MSTESRIVVVSGLPRSGTSMMMRMLDAGGMRVLSDAARDADDDNPRGYYELEAVMRSERDTGWVESAGDHVVKVVSPLLRYLPRGPRYAVIFMRRNLHEVLASQKRMLERRGEPDDRDPDATMNELVAHIEAVEQLLRQRDDMDTLFVSYARTVASPTHTVERVRAFVDEPLDRERMLAAVEPALYRQRS